LQTLSPSHLFLPTSLHQWRLHPFVPYIKPKEENNINKIELISVMPYQNGVCT
jgi:hypothetical protein